MDDRLIGVDVGGTKVSVAVFADGELSEPHVEPTERSSPDALLDQLVRLISAAAGDDGHVAVGLGVPSVVDWETGRVRSSVNIPLADVPLREIHELASRPRRRAAARAAASLPLCRPRPAPSVPAADSTAAWPVRSVVPERFRGGCPFGAPPPARGLSRTVLSAAPRLPEAAWPAPHPP